MPRANDGKAPAVADASPGARATTPRSASPLRRRTRIQVRNEEKILASALNAFSAHGYRGATLDEIAAGAGMSKPNLLYYFRGKEDLHATLLARLLDDWLDPLRALSADGEPLDEIRAYVRRKLEMARDRPEESRLFAAEVMSGAPRLSGYLSGELRALVDEKAEVIRRWIADGRLRPVDPHHLIFSIWATTQHYADFDAQIRLLIGDEGERFADASRFLETLFRHGLAPDAPKGTTRRG